MAEIDDLIELSKYAGMRIDLVQAGGGNTSIKLDGQTMLIKASGVQLADMDCSSGYSKVNYQIILKYLRDKKDGKNKTASEKSLLDEALMDGGRPSIETFLHAMTGTVTLHTHPAAVNILTARKEGKRLLRELFPMSVIADYATPGIDLAILLHAKLKQQPSSVVFLMNHGLIVSGPTKEEVIKITEATLKKIEAYLSLDLEVFHEATNHWFRIKSIVPRYSGIVWPVFNSIAENELKKNNGVLWEYKFCPDCVVYCGKKYLFLPDEYTLKEMQDFIESEGIPGIILHKNRLYVLANTVKKAQEIEAVLQFSAMVSAQNKGIPVNILTEAEQDFLLDCDKERYRKELK